MQADAEVVADLDLVRGAHDLAGGAAQDRVAALEHGEGAERV